MFFGFFQFLLIELFVVSVFLLNYCVLIALKFPPVFL